MVLCVHGSEDYIKAFEYFVKKNFALNIEWVTRRPQNSKYLLLCNVTSRIPEDINWVFENLDIKGIITSRMKNTRIHERHMNMFYVLTAKYDRKLNIKTNMTIIIIKYQMFVTVTKLLNHLDVLKLKKKL